jgi:hypothetical protein
LQREGFPMEYGTIKIKLDELRKKRESVKTN